MAKAMVRTVRPNPSDTPTKPMPRAGNAAARTAAPQPPSTSHAVPMNSAASLRVMAFPPIPGGRLVQFGTPVLPLLGEGALVRAVAAGLAVLEVALLVFLRRII